MPSDAKKKRDQAKKVAAKSGGKKASANLKIQKENGTLNGVQNGAGIEQINGIFFFSLLGLKFKSLLKYYYYYNLEF